MELIIGYSVLIITSLFIYLLRKQYLTLRDLKMVRLQLRKCLGLKQSSKNEDDYKFEHLDVDNQYIHPSVLLLKSLKYLDYMSQFENYIENSRKSNCSMEYLREFEKSKLESQRAVLRSTHLFSTRLSSAA